MGSRKTLKRAARGALKRKYFMSVLLVFTVGLLMGSYSFVSRVGPSGSGLSDTLSNAQIVQDLASGILDDRRPAPEDGSVAQYTGGVLAVFVNQITESGSVAFGVLNGLNQLIFRGRLVNSVLILVMSLVTLLYIVFVRNMLLVGECRYFLEHRRYQDTRLDRLLFVYRTGRTRNAAKVMLLRNVFSALWWLTVVGGVIKHYEYRMIPYILAEDPQIPWRDAFRLSKKLMYGDKWNVLKLDLSLLGWYALGWISYSLVSVFFLNPYVECINAELYMTLRAGKAGTEDLQLLWDRALAAEQIMPGAYPQEDYPLPLLHRHRWTLIDYRKDYSPLTIVLFFLTFSVTGWLWEVLHHLVSYGELVNRGTMAGPWLPIYGVGGVLILLVLKPLREKPALMFLGAFALCGVLEYGASWVLERLLHVRYWDYTGYFMNLNGRICLEGLLVFGLAGLGFTYVFAPLLDNLFSRIPKKPRTLAAALLAALFLADLCYSAVYPNAGPGITTPAPEVREEITQ